MTDKQKPVAWAVTACSRMFMGEFAEFDAKDEARRCGGTCVAYALYSAPVVAQQAEQGWQPIETAPRETEIFIGKFIDGKFKFGRSEMFYEQANEFAGETFSGWVWTEDECSSSITDSPTHWMQLPRSPMEGVSLTPSKHGSKDMQNLVMLRLCKQT